MSLNKLQLVNLALAKLGESPLQSLSDNRPAGRAIDVCYEPAKQGVLSLGPWPWAVKKTALTQVAGHDVDGWEYAYAIPSDCVRPMSAAEPGAYEANLANPSALDQWERIGGYIYSDLDELVLRYVADVGVEAFPADVANMFSIRLAADIATCLSRDMNTAAALDNRFNAEAQLVLNRALKSDRRYRDDGGSYLRARSGYTTEAEE